MVLKRIDFYDDAVKLNVSIACVQAVAEVESGGGGFIEDTMPPQPKILFEGHVFWRELKKAGIRPEDYLKELGPDGKPINKDIIYRTWIRKYYKGNQYSRLKKAENINIDCALKSASWGMFQIMGFNYKRCGFDKVDKFVSTMYIDENSQLECFTNYIKSSVHLSKALQSYNWEEFARLYNGPAYKKNKYAEKLEVAFNRFSGSAS